MKKHAKKAAAWLACIVTVALAAAMPLSAFAAELTDTGSGLLDGFSLCRRDPDDPYSVKHVGVQITLPGRASTCAEPGLAEGKICSSCGGVIIAQAPIPPKGHTWDEGNVTRAPTVEAEGERTYTCTVCGATMTEPIPKLSFDTGLVSQPAAVPSLSLLAADGSAAAYTTAAEGDTLVITSAQDNVTLTGTLDALAGTERVALVTPYKRSSFAVSSLIAMSSDGDTFSLAQNGATSALELSGWDVSYLLGE